MSIGNIVTSPEIKDNTELVFEQNLRPRTFNEIIGRKKEKENLNVMIQSAKKRNTSLDHILFHGPPGLGKTSFAHVIASEMNVELRITSGTVIEKTGDLAAILSSIEEGGILFIDEIHGLKRTLEEILYPVMEDNVLDIVIGKGPSAKTIRIDLPRFTIIGATTKLSNLSAPFRDRFGNHIRLDFYTEEELSELLLQVAKKISVKITPEGAHSIAEKSRGTPRIAIRFLKRIRDYIVVKEIRKIDEYTVLDCLDLLGINNSGFNEMDLKIIHALGINFSNKPVGLNTLSASIMEEKETIEMVYEPFLLMKGILKRTPKGRILTDRGLKLLNKLYPDL